MTAQPIDKKKTKRDLLKLMQIGGLAFAIPFEMVAGPFIGYFIGSYLKNRFGMHRYIMYLFIIMGFVAGIVSVVIIITMMTQINREKPNLKES